MSWMSTGRIDSFWIVYVVNVISERLISHFQGRSFDLILLLCSTSFMTLESIPSYKQGHKCRAIDFNRCHFPRTIMSLRCSFQSRFKVYDLILLADFYSEALGVWCLFYCTTLSYIRCSCCGVGWVITPLALGMLLGRWMSVFIWKPISAVHRVGLLAIMC